MLRNLYMYLTLYFSIKANRITSLNEYFSLGLDVKKFNIHAVMSCNAYLHKTELYKNINAQINDTLCIFAHLKLN